ncbi:MAG: L,D-transpeptidase family protein [Aggregatilineales bacterium]
MSVENHNQEANKSSRRTSSARERQMKRRERRHAMATLRDEGLSQLPNIPVGRSVTSSAGQIGLRLRDLLWYLRYRTPALKILAGTVVCLVILFAGSLLFSDKISPGVYALDMPLSGLTAEEAEARLLAYWNQELQIQMRMNETDVARMTPTDLGLTLDAAAMVEEARTAGLSGIPFAIGITPVINVDNGLAQQNLLELYDEFYIPPFEAGYSWNDGVVEGLPGTASQELDIALSLERLAQTPQIVVQNQRFDVSTLSNPPQVSDPAPYLDAATRFLNQDFQIVGYDALRNVDMPWQTTREEMARWLVADVNGLGLRMNTFEGFVDALNDRLNTEDNPRYLDVREAAQSVEQAILNSDEQAFLRVRYLPTNYTIASGDNGTRIGRKTGLPFGLIENVNPGVEWTALSIGQEIRLPSYDEVLPETPVPNKRIVVDLDALWLVAYENDEIVFNWPISSGQNEAPTSPGIFQILLHEEVAYGSSFSLCAGGTNQCAQWEMDWFMGIYEVIPGLMNGFHGNVLLPNGALLGGGGSTQRYSTFGCVMSDNEQAEALYRWADQGTMVELISSDFAPVSVLGQEAQDYIRSAAALHQLHDAPFSIASDYMQTATDIDT